MVWRRRISIPGEMSLGHHGNQEVLYTFLLKELPPEEGFPHLRCPHELSQCTAPFFGHPNPWGTAPEDSHQAQTNSPSVEPAAISWDQGIRAREGLFYQLISCVVLATGQQTKARKQPRSRGSAPGPSIIHVGPASGVGPLSGALISRANQPHVNYSPRLAFPKPVPGLCFSFLLSLPAKICVCLSVLLLGQKAGPWLWPCLRTRPGCAGVGISQQAGLKSVANPFIFRTWSSLLLVDSCH